jgi:hypothetical protein
VVAVAVAGCSADRGGGPVHVDPGSRALARLADPATADAAVPDAYLALVGRLPDAGPDAYVAAAGRADLPEPRRQLVRCAFFARFVVGPVRLRSVLADHDVADWFTDGRLADVSHSSYVPVGPDVSPDWGLYMVRAAGEPSVEAPRVYFVLSRHVEEDDLRRAIAAGSVPADLVILSVTVDRW